MANHKSAIKRMRQISKRREHNRYYSKTVRNAVKKFRELNEKKEAEEQLPKILSLIDKLAKRSVIHKNKAANLKSSLMRKANSLS